MNLYLKRISQSSLTCCALQGCITPFTILKLRTVVMSLSLTRFHRSISSCFFCARMVEYLSSNDGDGSSSFLTKTINGRGEDGTEASVVEFFERVEQGVQEEYSPTDVEIMVHDPTVRCETWYEILYLIC